MKKLILLVLCLVMAIALVSCDALADILPAGPQGEKGETGPAGPQGEKGDKGTTGESGQSRIVYAWETSFAFDLSPNVEYIFENPVTDICVDAFTSYDDGHSETWTMIFKAGDIQGTSYFPSGICWIGEKPTFKQGYVYWLHFIPFRMPRESEPKYFGFWKEVLCS